MGQGPCGVGNKSQDLYYFKLNCRFLLTSMHLLYIFRVYYLDILGGYTMKTISLKIDDSIFSEIESIVSAMQKPRNRYINEAIDHYNKLQKRKMIEEKLKRESIIVKDDSMSVLKEFEDIDYEN
jgi:hypothetical protein